MGISIGLVGLGTFGSHFAVLFKCHPLVDRIALCDMEPDRLAAFAGRESFRDKFRESDGFTDYDDILRADLDALAIFTQPWLHAPQAVRGLEAGKHVCTAVPIISVPDGDEILEWTDRLVRACEKTGHSFMLAETTYYRPQAVFCRRKAAEGAFGRFIFSEGEYFHDVEHGLRWVKEHRESSRSGLLWQAEKKKRDYAGRGIKNGPMHYPTHSVSGPMSAMNAHAVKVSCVGSPVPAGDDYFAGSAFGNETAFFRMSNGSVMRICEYRDIALHGRENFSIYGTGGSFFGSTTFYGAPEGMNRWMERKEVFDYTNDEIREELPPEVLAAFSEGLKEKSVYGGHGGSHAFLVHEFVSAVAEGRRPAISAWEAARYMAAGVTAHKSALRDGEWLEVPDWGDGPR